MKTKLSALILIGVIGSGATAHMQVREARPTTATATTHPIIWKDPGDIASRDLWWGAGSAEGAPVAPFTFVKEDTSGTKPKIHVTDARGITWGVKFGEERSSNNEVHSEIAASRLSWALGYLVEETYYVPAGRILGVKKLSRAAPYVGPDGSFHTARFEKRPTDIVRTGRRWGFDSNPFVTTKELSGLKILTTLLGNWDAKDGNSEVLEVSRDRGVEEWYVLTDLGSTFGKMGGMMSHSRWNLDDYKKQNLVDGVDGNTVKLGYHGSAAISEVPLAHAQWFAAQVSQLTPAQIEQAFKAAGVQDAQAAAFCQAFVGKIGELRRALSAVK